MSTYLVPKLLKAPLCSPSSCKLCQSTVCCEKVEPGGLSDPVNSCLMRPKLARVLCEKNRTLTVIRRFNN